MDKPIDDQVAIGVVHAKSIYTGNDSFKDVINVDHEAIVAAIYASSDEFIGRANIELAHMAVTVFQELFGAQGVVGRRHVAVIERGDEVITSQYIRKYLSCSDSAAK